MRSLFSNSILKDMIAFLNVKYMSIDNCNRPVVTKTSSGYEISAYDPSFEKKIEAARRGMKKYRNALIELAK